MCIWDLKLDTPVKQKVKCLSYWTNIIGSTLTSALLAHSFFMNLVDLCKLSPWENTFGCMNLSVFIWKPLYFYHCLISNDFISIIFIHQSKHNRIVIMCLILFHKIYVDSCNIFEMEEKTSQTITVSNDIFTISLAIFRTQSNIYDSGFWENSFRLKVVNYFCKKLHLKCLTVFWIRLWSW